MADSINSSITNFQYVTGILEYIKLENTALHIDDKSDRKIDMDYGDILIKQKEDDLYGEISLTLSLKVHNSDDRGLNIDYKFKGLFTSKQSEDEDEFRELLKTNGLAVLYSMARANISTFSSLSGVQTINIPMINVYNYVSKK